MRLINLVAVTTAFCLSIIANAQVTKVGNDTLIDVACWNVEWLGDADNGPSNETLQYNNVKDVLTKTDMDVWGLAEVSNSTTFYNLLLALSAYDGTESSYSQTQKTALVWKKAKFDLISYTNINDASQPDFYNAFAGRYPLEVVLKTKGGNAVDTLYFYVVHLKANSGSGDQDSYNRRKNASVYLKKFLDTQRRNKKVIVLGDWNDDVDRSVVMINSSYLESPFQNFVNDSAKYLFTSLSLSLAGETSYPNFNPKNMIDHQLNSRALSDSFYVKRSAAVMKQLSTQISGYTNNTSDHYPVYARYNFKRYPKVTPVDTPHSGLNSWDVAGGLNIYPNPANKQVYLSEPLNLTSASLIDQSGRSVPLPIAGIQQQMLVLPEGLTAGVYVLYLQTSEGVITRKLQLTETR